jgi:hypothetical protein
MKIEYKVRPVTRWVVTRYQAGESSDDGRMCCAGRSETRGEFDNEQKAYDVGYALAKLEAGLRELPPGDMGVIFPDPVGSIGQTLVPSGSI